MPSSQAIQSFLALRQECIWVRSCFNTFCSLFESGEETSAVLHQSAPAFFRDINLILQEHFVLQVCRITDPAESNGHENLTIANMNQTLEKEGLLSTAIADEAKRIQSYRSLVVDARNQLISHADKSKILSKMESDPHSRSDVEDFFSGLYKYVDLVGEALKVGPLDFTYTGSEGDVDSFLSCLKRGLNPNAGEKTWQPSTA